MKEANKLEDQAQERKSNYKYLKKLSKSELEEEEKDLVNLSIKIKDLEDEKRAAVNAFKAKINPLKDDYFILLDTCRSGLKWVTEDVLIIHNISEDRAEYYTEDGELVFKRPLTIDERQIKILRPGLD